jgi:DNA-binding MarR family transcriptional regulator
MMLGDLPRSNPTYFRFLQRTQAIKISPNGKDLTAPEMDLLENVALRHFENRAYTVSEALALQHMGSPATLHKRLKRLRTWGLLRYEQHPEDHRTKYLQATPLAMAHFERLGDAMRQVMQG